MIANHIVASDAFEDPGGTWIEAARLAAVRLVAIEALRRKPDAKKLLRRHAAESPQAARLASQAVIVLAGRALPMLRAVATTDFNVAAGRIHWRHPVEAVAAEIHQSSAGVEVRAQRVVHLDRVVLGMGRGQHSFVRRQ